MPAPAPAVPLADRTMRARRAGRCALCGGPVLVGARIGRVAGRWSEVACILAAQRGLRRPRPNDGLRPL